MMKRVWYWSGLGMLWCCLLSAQDQVPAPFERGDHAAESGNSSTAVPEEGGDDPFDPAMDPEVPKQLQLQMELIEISQEDYNEFLFGREVKADATPLRKELQGWIKQGKAKVLETTMCVAKSGQKAKVESTDEFIYPTEFEPAGTTENKEGVKTTSPVVTPMAFEVRNLGMTCEFEPCLDASGKVTELRYGLELAWLTGETVWSTRKDSLGNIEEVKQPRIFCLKSDTQLALQNGKYAFASVLSPKDAQGRLDGTRKVLLFVKADLLTLAP